LLADQSRQHRDDRFLPGLQGGQDLTVFRQDLTVFRQNLIMLQLRLSQGVQEPSLDQWCLLNDRPLFAYLRQFLLHCGNPLF
jgi:hypothetical protein